MTPQREQHCPERVRPCPGQDHSQQIGRLLVGDVFQGVKQTEWTVRSRIADTSPRTILLQSMAVGRCREQGIFGLEAWRSNDWEDALRLRLEPLHCIADPAALEAQQWHKRHLFGR